MSFGLGNVLRILEYGQLSFFAGKRGENLFIQGSVRRLIALRISNPQIKASFLSGKLNTLL